jgi:glycosyltransferase involved in cell wall biosynthesis
MPKTIADIQGGQSSNLPRITIVTPTFNSGEFLEATIQSVLGQDYPNLEYFIVDGGSSDGTVDIIKKYEKQLAWWVSEKDSGQYDAVNKGLARATGEILGWLNGDDLHLPYALHTVAAAMGENPGVRWVSTLRPMILNCDGTCNSVLDIKGFSRQAFLDGWYLPYGPACRAAIQQESTFWRRSLWEEAGGRINPEYPLAGDFDLWARFYEHDELVGIEAPLAGFRVRKNQRSEDREEYLVEGNRALAEARRRMGWKPSAFRDAAMKARLFEVPKLRGVLRSQWGYAAKRVVRADMRARDSAWVVREYRFP